MKTESNCLQEIEAKMLASGLSKKDGFIHSCVYNRARAIDKKENDKYTVEPETGL